MQRRYLTCIFSLLSLCFFQPLSVLADIGQVRIFYAEQYGLVGDGLTNNLSAFHKLANDLNANGGGRIVFPKGKVFVVKFTDDCSGGYTKYPVSDAMALDISNCKDVTIDLNGSSIIVFPNHSTKYCVIRFFNCQNFEVKNGTLIGDAVKHDYSPVIYSRKEYITTHEWGYGVCNAGSQGIVDKMNISYMTGDGLFVGSVSLNKKAYHAMTTIDGCEVSYCRRNGITATSSQSLFIKNTKVHHIGNILGKTLLDKWKFEKYVDWVSWMCFKF